MFALVSLLSVAASAHASEPASAEDITIEEVAERAPTAVAADSTMAVPEPRLVDAESSEIYPVDYRLGEYIEGTSCGFSILPLVLAPDRAARVLPGVITNNRYEADAYEELLRLGQEKGDFAVRTNTFTWGHTSALFFFYRHCVTAQGFVAHRE